MATLKINVMSIVAIVLAVFSIVAVAMYESSATWPKERPSGEHTYEAFLIIAILLALVVLIVTCLDIEKLTGKTFLIYAVTAVLLLIGLIVFGVQLHKDYKEANNAFNEKNKVTQAILEEKFLNRFRASGDQNTMQSFLNFRTASAVFCGLALLVAIVGTIAPFVCNKSK